MNTALTPARDNRFLQVLLLVFLCLLLYIPSLKNGFIWDDDACVHRNPWIQQAEGLKTIWLTHEMPGRQYYPMVFSTFWLQHKLWGLNPFGYHAVSLVLHLLNALALFWIVLKLYPRAAFVCALLFTVHPIQVETVAWISEQKNLLSLFFLLLTVLAYLRFDRTQSTKCYWLSVVLFGCALLSKSIAVCFVFFPVLYRWWLDGKVGWRQIRLSLVFVALGLLAALQTAFLEFHHAGAQGNEFDLSPVQRVLLSGRIVCFYAYKIILPHKFMFFYPRWMIDAGTWWQWLFPVAVVAAFVLLVQFRKPLGRGAVALAGFYVLSLFPALGFINVYPMRFSFVADHFSYFSTPCFLLLVCAGAATVLDGCKKRFMWLCSRSWGAARWGLLSVVILLLGGQVMALTQNYKDEETLWNQLIRMNPKAWIAYNNLGLYYQGAGNMEEALNLFNKAIEINHDYAEAYNNRGCVYSNRGEYDRAIVEFNRAIEIAPNFGDPYYNRGNVYYRKGDHDQAFQDYDMAIAINSNFALAYNNRAVVYFERQKYAECWEDLRKAQMLGYNIRPEVMEQIKKLAGGKK